MAAAAPLRGGLRAHRPLLKVAAATPGPGRSDRGHRPPNPGHRPDPGHQPRTHPGQPRTARRDPAGATETPQPGTPGMSNAHFNRGPAYGLSAEVKNKVSGTEPNRTGRETGAGPGGCDPPTPPGGVRQQRGRAGGRGRTRRERGRDPALSLVLPREGRDGHGDTGTGGRHRGVAPRGSHRAPVYRGGGLLAFGRSGKREVTGTGTPAGIRGRRGRHRGSPRREHRGGPGGHRGR